MIVMSEQVYVFREGDRGVVRTDSKGLSIRIGRWYFLLAIGKEIDGDTDG